MSREFFCKMLAFGDTHYFCLANPILPAFFQDGCLSGNQTFLHRLYHTCFTENQLITILGWANNLYNFTGWLLRYPQAICQHYDFRGLYAHVFLTSVKFQQMRLYWPDREEVSEELGDLVTVLPTFLRTRKGDKLRHYLNTWSSDWQPTTAAVMQHQLSYDRTSRVRWRHLHTCSLESHQVCPFCSPRPLLFIIVIVDLLY